MTTEIDEKNVSLLTNFNMFKLRGWLTWVHGNAFCLFAIITMRGYGTRIRDFLVSASPQR